MVSAGVGLDEAAVAVGQVQHEVVGLLLHPADHHPRLAKVALGVAWRMSQRHEHLPRLAAVLPYVALDYRVLAIEPVLIPEPLKDALGGVALLLGDPQVLFQNPVDHAGKRLQLGLARRAMPPVARRHGVGNNLAHRVSVQPEHPGSLPDAHAFHHYRPADPQIHVHSIHPSHRP